MSQYSNDLTSHADIGHIPSSIDSVSKTFRSKSHKLLPPKTDYYYQSNFKNVRKFKAFEEDNESQSSDEDHQPIVYPENRHLGHTMKI